MQHCFFNIHERAHILPHANISQEGQVRTYTRASLTMPAFTYRRPKQCRQLNEGSRPSRRGLHQAGDLHNRRAKRNQRISVRRYVHLRIWNVWIGKYRAFLEVWDFKKGFCESQENKGDQKIKVDCCEGGKHKMKFSSWEIMNWRNYELQKTRKELFTSVFHETLLTPQDNPFA